jgi:DNA-binding NtrC family response regulator
MTILLVDDDDGFRTALGELLAEDGHVVRMYGSTAELPPFAELPVPGVLISDYQLGPGEDGLSFAQRFNSAHPGVPVILVTAHVSDHLTRTVSSAPYLRMLPKPVDYDDLHRLLHEIPASDQDA